MELHARIRSLRRLQKRTLREIASRCGFTVSLLSKIESGKTVPPVATLTRIAEALGVSLASLLDTSRKDDATTLTRAPAASGTRTEKGYAFHLLAAERPAKAMQPILFTARRGEIKSGPLAHGGEEFVYVIEGSMRYTVGGTSYTLSGGDSLYFDAEQEHDLEPVTESVRYLAVFYERGTNALANQRKHHGTRHQRTARQSS